MEYTPKGNKLLRKQGNPGERSGKGCVEEEGKGKAVAERDFMLSAPRDGNALDSLSCSFALDP